MEISDNSCLVILPSEVFVIESLAVRLHCPLFVLAMLNVLLK